MPIADFATSSSLSALHDARQRLERMREADAIGLLIFDLRSGVLLEANDAFLKMSGYTHEDVLSGCLDWQTMTPHEWYDSSVAQLEKLAATGKIGPYEKEYFRKDGSRAWMMFSGRELPDGTLAEYVIDIGRYKRTEAELRESDDRQTFLLQLSDALRPLSDPRDVQIAATHLLGEHLHLSRVRFVDIEHDEAVTRAEYTMGVAPMPQRFKYTDLGYAVVTAFRRGDPMIVTNTKYDPRFDTFEREILLAAKIASFVTVMQVNHGGSVGAIICHSATPRDWTTHEITLIHETAERAWAAVARAAAEAALRATQQTLQSFYDTAPFMMGIGEIVGDRSVIVSANQKTAEFFGKRVDEMVGQSTAQLGTPNNIETLWLQQIRKSEQEGRPIRFEYEDPRSAEKSWLSATVASIVAGPSGRTRYSFVVEDVTARKVSEAALHESEVRSRTLLEGVAQAFWESDATGAQVSDSPSWRAYTGQTVEEMMGNGWANAVHPEDREYAAAEWQEAVAAGRKFNAEFRLRSPDGGYRWTNVRAAPLFDDAGAISKWVGMNIDIDDRKRCELALRDADHGNQ